MLGLGYISKQTYSYEDYEQLLNIIDITGTSRCNFDAGEKIIEYTIDRKQWIRLNDLIYWIQIQFVKFHVGQLLDLFEKLLLYILELKQKGIDHQYLDSNRIWLVLRPESEYPSIIHSNLIYDIAFTGYQCPFYENPSIQAKQGTIKMQEIILEIIEFFLEKQIGLIKNNRLRKKEKKFFEELKQFLTQGLIQKVLELINQIKNQYEYNINTGKLLFDKELPYLSSRKSRVKDVIKAFQLNLQNIENVDQLITEEYFQIITQTFVASLDKIGFYAAPKFNVESFLENQQKRLKLLNDKLQTQFEEPIKEILNEQIEKSSNQYKFQFSKQEIVKMQSEILDALMNIRIISYFNNSYYFQLQENLNDFKKVRISKSIIKMVEEYFAIGLHLKILNLILELI